MREMERKREENEKASRKKRKVEERKRKEREREAETLMHRLKSLFDVVLSSLLISLSLFFFRCIPSPSFLLPFHSPFPGLTINERDMK